MRIQKLMCTSSNVHIPKGHSNITFGTNYNERFRSIDSTYRNYRGIIACATCVAILLGASGIKNILGNQFNLLEVGKIIVGLGGIAECAYIGGKIIQRWFIAKYKMDQYSRKTR